ncbi:MAG: hypothetical protein AAGD38_04650 [Acidobacteriota bacterium]
MGKQRILTSTAVRLGLLALMIIVAGIGVDSALQAQQGYVVIVNGANSVDSLTKEDISRYLLKKKMRWDDGTPVEPVDLDPSSPVREALTRDVHGRSVSSIKNYWQRQIFSGSNTPPAELSESEVVAYVRSNPGAIGYVSASANLSGGVKRATVQ